MEEARNPLGNEAAVVGVGTAERVGGAEVAGVDGDVQTVPGLDEEDEGIALEEEGPYPANPFPSGLAAVVIPHDQSAPADGQLKSEAVQAVESDALFGAAQAGRRPEAEGDFPRGRVADFPGDDRD